MSIKMIYETNKLMKRRVACLLSTVIFLYLWARQCIQQQLSVVKVTSCLFLLRGTTAFHISIVMQEIALEDANCSHQIHSNLRHTQPRTLMMCHRHSVTAELPLFFNGFCLQGSEI